MFTVLLWICIVAIAIYAIVGMILAAWVFYEEFAEGNLISIYEVLGVILILPIGIGLCMLGCLAIVTLAKFIDYRQERYQQQ
ncbi:MAG: hypothetical protein WCX71_00835 [Candidatus Buchananbacteria bacterium]